MRGKFQECEMSIVNLPRHFGRRLRQICAGARLALFVVLAFSLSLVGCREDSRPPDAPPGAVVLTAWFHSGRQAERRTIQDQIKRFNQSQREVYIRPNVIPEDTYNGQVQAAALAGDLPDILEFDGPFLYNYVWQGNLHPLGDRLGEEIQSDLLPSIVEQGTFRDAFYAVGTFDSGLGLYGRRSLLEAAGARIPTKPSESWSVAEFEEILADLAKGDPDGAVLDLKLNYEGEWYTTSTTRPSPRSGWLSHGAAIGTILAMPTRLATIWSSCRCRISAREPGPAKARGAGGSR